MWEPRSDHNAFSDHTQIAIEGDPIDLSASPGAVPSSKVKLPDTVTSSVRDGILQFIAKTSQSNLSISSFPGAELLDLIVRTGVLKRVSTDAWLHLGTLCYDKLRPHLLTALIAAGCTSFAVPSINKAGLILQEIVRLSLEQLVS